MDNLPNPSSGPYSYHDISILISLSKIHWSSMSLAGRSMLKLRMSFDYTERGLALLSFHWGSNKSLRRHLLKHSAKRAQGAKRVKIGPCSRRRTFDYQRRKREMFPEESRKKSKGEFRSFPKSWTAHITYRRRQLREDHQTKFPLPVTSTNHASSHPYPSISESSLAESLPQTSRLLLVDMMV